MQIKIVFSSEKDIIIPIHYNSLVQAFIYNNIDDELASFLHDRGYQVNNRVFKLFTFSRILNRGKKEGRHFNFGNKIQLIVASPIEEFCKSIANHMLQSDSLYIGQSDIRVDQIQIIPYQVNREDIMVETLSPIVTYSTLYKADGSRYTLYFTPDESDFSRIVSENLVRKYNAFYNDDISLDEVIEIVPDGQYKQSITYYKDFLVKGISGRFILRGDMRLLQMGVDTGFGSKNSQGYGCVKLL